MSGFEGDWTFVMNKLHDNLNRKSKRTKSQTIKTAEFGNIQLYDKFSKTNISTKLKFLENTNFTKYQIIIKIK